MKRGILFAGAATAVLVFCSLVWSAGDAPWRTVAGFPFGRYIVLEPKNPPRDQWPLLFVLHGLNGEAQSYGRLWREATGGAYLVVAPQALPKIRGDMKISMWNGSGHDDRNYLLAVWDEIHKKYPIDPARTVVIGYSAGGYALWTIVNARNDQLAAVIFQAAVPRWNEPAIKGKHVYLIAGEADGSFDREKGGKAIDYLTRMGADVQLYVAPGADHGSVYDKVQSAAKWIADGFPSASKPAGAVKAPDGGP